MRRVDRLSPADLAVLWPEDLGWPQDVGLLAVLDTGEGFDVERLRAHIASRIGLLSPRFRAVLVRPRRGLGNPYWVDAGPLDMDYHVRTMTLPTGDDDEMLEACEQVRRERFDVGRPRWHLTLLEGLPGGRTGLLMVVHHCLVDGVAGVVALGAFADVDRPISVPPLPPPRPAPGTADLLVDVVLGMLRRAGAAGTALRRPRRTWQRLARDVHAWRRTTDAGPSAGTSLHATLGPHRRYTVLRSDLAVAKAVSRAHGATVNDLLLCVLSGGLRELLLSRGENPAGMLLRAAVPVAMHGVTGPVEGNRAGGLLLALAVGEDDPAARLRQIATDSAERKADAVLPGAASPFFAAGIVQRLVLRLAARQRLSTSYVANVPGPPMALSIAGAPILEAFPLVPLLGNLTVGIGALSYAGQLAVTVVADADACPDLDVLVTAMRQGLDTLAQTLPTQAAAGGGVR